MGTLLIHQKRESKSKREREGEALVLGTMSAITASIGLHTTM